jgi:hypothetical protein
MKMHDVTMTQKKKITSNSNNGDFSGSLHHVFDLLINKEHDVRSIGWSTLGDHDIMHFIEDVVHHIQLEVFIQVGTHKAAVRKLHELNKGNMNSIPITSRGGDVFPEHAKQNIVQREQSLNSANLPLGRVKRSQAILIRLNSMQMHTMTNWHTVTLKIIVQKLGKLIEVGLTHGIPTHPSERERLICLK